MLERVKLSVSTLVGGMSIVVRVGTTLRAFVHSTVFCATFAASLIARTVRRRTRAKNSLARINQRHTARRMQES